MASLQAILDTNVLLNYFRWNTCARQVEADHALRSSGFAPTISIVSVGELLAFAKNPDWDKAKRDRLNSFIEQCVVIDVNRKAVLDAYAELHDINKRSGTNIGQNDLWIAASAKAAGLAVLTSDADFLLFPQGSVRVIKVHARSGVTEQKT